jgi:hypothetical protein
MGKKYSLMMRWSLDHRYSTVIITMKVLNLLFFGKNVQLHQNGSQGRVLINLILALIVVGTIASVTPAFAETNKTITINPVGVHASGEKFNITGITTDDKCKKIGIEIFPKAFWDTASAYAREGKDGRMVFMEIPSTKERFHPTNIKLVRYNSDDTQSTEEYEPTQDHWTKVVAVNKTSSGEKQWNVQVEKNDNGTSFSPGSYRVNVWDATAQVEKHDFPYENGWNVITQKIYPSTARINIWDSKNQKDMQYADFTIKS